jgi:rhomboid protease GluP
MSDSYSSENEPQPAPQSRGGARPVEFNQANTIPVRMPLTRPLVSYALIGFTILIYVLQEASGYLTGQDQIALMGMKINEAIIAGQYWRLITPMFLHGSVLHIAFNMYALYALGPSLERYFGHWRFLALYLLAGYAGNVASFIFTLSPSLGSSTAIFGVLGAEGVFLYQNRKIFAGFARGALQRVIMIGLINLIIGGVSTNIDNWGHLGGIAGGIIFTALAGPILAIKGIPPDLYVEDEREPIRIFQAAVGLALAISVIAAIGIYLR